MARMGDSKNYGKRKGSFDNKGTRGDSFSEWKKDGRGDRKGTRSRPRGGDRRGRDPRGDRRGEPRMYKVICDKCGAKCEVPFNPTEGKPIYCNDCFREQNKTKEAKDYSEELEEINEKLEKIMSALSIK